MKPIYSINEFNSASNTDNLPLKCYQCENTFQLSKKRITEALNPDTKDKALYCSLKCLGKSQRTKVSLPCDNCNIQFLKLPNQIKKSKSGNHFCCKSCAVTYNNKNKKHGTRRSKLEIFVEENLTIQYPNMNILFNTKDAIQSELDIYIPELNIAIEINGIFHYKPIYGEDKLTQIQKNDISKEQACIDQNIELYRIDISKLTHFNERNALKYLDSIIKIIESKKGQ